MKHSVDVIGFSFSLTIVTSELAQTILFGTDTPELTIISHSFDLWRAVTGCGPRSVLTFSYHPSSELRSQVFTAAGDNYVTCIVPLGTVDYYSELTVAGAWLTAASIESDRQDCHTTPTHLHCTYACTLVYSSLFCFMLFHFILFYWKMNYCTDCQIKADLST